jgi:hypothetical protein
MTSCNLSTNFITATNIAGTIGNIGNVLYVTSNIYTSNVSSCNINVLQSNCQQNWQVNESNIFTTATKFVAIGKSNPSQKLDVEGTILGSNVAFSNFLIYRGSNIVDSSGKIDFHTWISNKMFSSNAVGATIGNLVLTSNATTLTGTAMSLNYKSLFLNNGNIAGDLLQHVNELAGNSNFGITTGDKFDPSSQSSNILPNWNSVIWKPIYHDSNYNLGFSSNVFFNKSSQLCTTEPLWDYTRTSNGMFKTFNAPFVRSNVVIDFNTLTATFCNVITSNLTVLGTTTSNINTSNLVTNVLTASNAFLSNVWASNVGINQINPLYNLDVKGTTRVQWDLLVNSNITCGCNLTVGSNLGIGTTNPTYKLDVNGSCRIQSSGTGFIVQSSTLTTGAGQVANLTVGKALTTNNTANFRYTHLGGDGNTSNYVGVGLWGNDDILNVAATGRVGIGTTTPAYKLDVNGDINVSGDWYWAPSKNYNLYPTTNNQEWSFDLRNQSTYSGCYWQVWSDKSSASIIAVRGDTERVGVGTTTPTDKLDVRATSMRLQGGTGATPTIFYLNSTGVGNTTSQIQFVNSGHYITCTDTNNYDGISSIGGGHNIYYKSGGHNFSGPARFNDSLSVGGSTFKGLFCGSASISSSGGASSLQTTITHGWNISGTQTFTFSEKDTASPLVYDTHSFKVTSVGANSFDLHVMRADNVDGSPWSRSFTLMYTIIVS